MAYKESEKTKIINEISERVSKGEALRNILNEDGQISSITFYKWLDGDEAKAKQYARACEDRENHMFEDILEIADDQEKDVYIDKDNVEHVNHNIIKRSQIRIDSRKWMLGKMRPSKYGDRTINENLNKNVEIQLTNEENEEEIKALAKEMGIDYKKLK